MEAALQTARHGDSQTGRGSGGLNLKISAAVGDFRAIRIKHLNRCSLASLEKETRCRLCLIVVFGMFGLTVKCFYLT